MLANACSMCSPGLALSDSLRPWNQGEEESLSSSNRGIFHYDAFRPIALLHFCHCCVITPPLHPLEEREMIKELVGGIEDGFCLRVLAYDVIYFLKNT